MSYSPLHISGNQTGLVQSREEFLLPNDAYPVLENAFVWRERIKRKQGTELIGGTSDLSRFRRIFSAVSIGDSSASPWTFILFSTVSPAITEPNAELQPGTVVIVMGGVTFTDQGNGILTSPTTGNSGVINYITSSITLITTVSSGTAATVSFNYFPSLPVMGLRSRDLNAINNQQTVGFDTTYAYRFSNGWQEFIAGETWTGNDSDFFWTTNYWVSSANLKLFWVTNFSGTSGDPTRYTDAVTWTDFTPTIDAAGDVVAQCLCILPFRSRLVMFNTYEGGDLSTSVNFPQRIRWAAIGNPIPDGDYQPWRDDIRGQGGFLDIPTNEEIVSVGFVRDNLVIYCSRSTWQLRYTGRSIAPFQIEKVNSELGAESTFSTIQFDTSLVGIGDKGIVECDSFKSNRIDIKIPDLVFQFNDANNGTERIQGIRDFVQRLAYWTYPYQPGTPYDIRYPNRRLVYNYENDSWSIFTDSITALGTFLPSSGRTWANTQISWQRANFSWVNRPQLIPDIIGGNQQGYVFYLDAQVSNDPSLSITAITGNTTTPTQLTVENHNLIQDQVIQITGIEGTGYANLNNLIFGVDIIDEDNFFLYLYTPSNGQFETPQLDPPATYIGGGEIALREGFTIQSKKFNYADQGESIQIGFIDLLMKSTDSGAISLNVFVNYNNSDPVNVEPQNDDPDTNLPDTFFNSIIQTSNPNPGKHTLEGTKYMQRIYCPVRGNYLTLVYTLSNAQLIGVEQESDVQIDSQIIWNRPAGRITNR